MLLCHNEFGQLNIIMHLYQQRGNYGANLTFKFHHTHSGCGYNIYLSMGSYPTVNMNMFESECAFNVL